MPKVTLIDGERLFVEFALSPEQTIPERLALKLENGRATIQVLALDDKGEIVATDTIFDVQVVPQPIDQTMQDFAETLVQIFGGGVFTVDENGIRPVKPPSKN